MQVLIGSELDGFRRLLLTAWSRMHELGEASCECVNTEEFAAASGAMKDVLLGLGLETV